MPNELVERNLVNIPAIIARSGGNAGFAYEEFFKASISNEHTRRAYARIVGGCSPGAKRTESSYAS